VAVADPIARRARSPLAALLGGVTPPGATSAFEQVREGADEHAAGRRAAVRAARAQHAAGEVTGARGSRPCWPPGVVGSISHCAGWAAAVVAASARYGAIGLDLEISGSLPAEDAAIVCSAVEQSVLAGLASGPRRDASATLHWVGKEAAFKAWDSWCDGALWGVDPASLVVDAAASGDVHVHPAPELAERLPGLPPLSGRWADATGLVVVVLTAPAGPAPSTGCQD
jgi:4'-phosphopantetheinyl transferase EntD